MRVRTALVNPSKASGVPALFDLAVERNLAWLVGVGHVYADLEKVAKQHGYLLEVVTPSSEESPGHWVAVRKGLVHEEILHNDNGNVAFAPTRDKLGSVSIGAEDVVFEKHEDRVKEHNTSIVPVEYDDFRYTEVLYSVKPLKD